MATKQKKTGGSRTTSSARSAGNGRRGSPSAGKKSKKPAPRPYRREIGAVVFFLLAIFSAFPVFGLDAILVDTFAQLIKGLVGYGYWITPPVLLLASYILFTHHGRPVMLRLICTLCLPVALGAVVHGFLKDPLNWNRSLPGLLWDTGVALDSGGLLSGLLAQSAVYLVTSLGCTILFVLAFLLLALGAFNKSLLDVADWIFNRPQYEYEPQPTQCRTRPVPQSAERLEDIVPTGPKPRPEIDIPVDDGPLVGKEPPQPAAKKKGFFNRISRVPAPDQVLAGIVNEQHPAAPPSLEEEPAADSVPACVQEPVAERTAVPVPEPLRPEPVILSPPVAEPHNLACPEPQAVQEPTGKKLTAEEHEKISQEVAQSINQSMEEDKPYQYPPLSLLNQKSGMIGGEALAELNANRQRLSDTIHSFGIDANIVNVTRGPSVTRYELELDQGVRLNKLTNLADDIALALGATGVRIAPIPDQIAMVGIEVPNKLVSPVNIHEVLSSKAFIESKSKVSFALGKDIGGNCIVGNIAKLPHLLIAGTTGSGKSVCTNSLIISLLYKATPEEVRLIMVDPKMVELGIYNGIPHLLIPVVTDPKKAAGALQWAVTEMMKRYRTFSEAGVRDLPAYNKYVERKNMEDPDQQLAKMPQVVVIIDELADLMLVAAKEVEESICRVAQMGRASGIHLVIATQRPSADVITGLMKANIPSRIAFAVASAMESRIILDSTGAEKLVGRGDMLFAPMGNGKPTRVQGCLISDQEVAAVVEFIKRSSQAQYSDEVMSEIEQHAAEKEKNSKGIGGSAPGEAGGGEYDELIDAATEVLIETGQASVSLLQRRLKLGYARAARLVDQLEEKGIVGPFEGSKPRQLLITKEQWDEMRYRREGGSAGTEGGAAASAEANAAPFDADAEMDRAEEDTL